MVISSRCLFWSKLWFLRCLHLSASNLAVDVSSSRRLEYCSQNRIVKITLRNLRQVKLSHYVSVNEREIKDRIVVLQYDSLCNKSKGNIRAEIHMTYARINNMWVDRFLYSYERIYRLNIILYVEQGYGGLRDSIWSAKTILKPVVFNIIIALLGKLIVILPFFILIKQDQKKNVYIYNKSQILRQINQRPNLQSYCFRSTPAWRVYGLQDVSWKNIISPIDKN